MPLEYSLSDGWAETRAEKSVIFMFQKVSLSLGTQYTLSVSAIPFLSLHPMLLVLLVQLVP